MILPPEVAGFVQMLGILWPNIDEDEIRKDATAWRTVTAGTDRSGVEADTSVRRTQADYRGESATAMAGRWNATGGSGGHLSQAAAAARVVPVVLDGTANVVTAVKLVVGTQAASTLVNVAQLVAFGGAAGATAAYARMLLARNAAGKGLREAGEGTAKVLAPGLRSKATATWHRIFGDLRGLGRPGGTPALAGAGGRSVGPRAMTGPRHARDYMATMGRNNNNARRGSGGRGGRSGGGRSGGARGRGGGGGGIRNLFRRDSSGKIHGALPASTRGMTKEEAERVQRELLASISRRETEQRALGEEAGHRTRINMEKEALRKIREDIQRRWG
ncbi:WXG100-like domain-containing protein [Nonomuraea helvata]|uniref:Outer membrane channel protein CpnT-like N-terminal domain-containing protein n=1 Tax=Nonomuraea helvata TaxID=37484 RepID=A0ABV5RXW9_9ACTN